MAYKFQTLAATMSGSLTQEGDFTVKNDAGTTGFSATAAGAVSGSGALSAGGNLLTAGTVKFTGVADTAIAVSADSLYFKDADGTMKSDSVADLMTAAAGAGLAASSGVLAVDIDELNAGTTLHQTEDHFMYSDDGTEKKITFSDLQDSIFADVSGDATVAAGGALTIGSDTIETAMLNDNIISGQTELAHADIADADEFMISDGGALKRVGVDSLRDHYFGVVSGDATIADGGALTIAANAVQDSMVNDDVATGLAGAGLGASSGVLAVQASGSLIISSDKVSITGSFAGDCLDSGPNESVNAMLTMNVVADESTIESVGLAALRVKSAGITATQLATSVAGAGLAGGGGTALSLDIDELDALGGAGLHQTQDHFVFSDNGTEKKITFSNLQDAVFADVSGDATIAAGGALTIAAQAVENSMLADDAVGADELAANAVVEASIVDNAVTLAKMAGITRGSIILGDSSGDPSYLAKGSAAQFLQSDGTDPSYVSISGDATIAAGGALTIAANAVEDSMVNDNVATGLAGVGLSAASGVMALDFNELSAATVDVANDSIALIDANDSNATKKESIADLVAGMAGAGLSAASGQLSVTGNNVALKADGNALVEGYNYFADASSNATVTLPSGPAVGDVVVVKAGNLTSAATIIVNKGSADHRIDGLEGIILESPFAAVTMVYAVADNWKIV